MDLATFFTFLALIIASLALGVSVWNSWEQRKHNRLSLKPYLTEFVHHNTKNEKSTSTELKLINKGLGTAYIKKYKLLDKKGNTYNFQKKMEEFLDQKGSKNRTITNLTTDYALAPLEEITLIEIRETEGIDLKKVVEELEKDFTLVIDYESAYGEKFSKEELDEKLKNEV